MTPESKAALSLLKRRLVFAEEAERRALGSQDYQAAVVRSNERAAALDLVEPLIASLEAEIEQLRKAG
jgi:hypothetical protein